jgi:hypothetical protein
MWMSRCNRAKQDATAQMKQHRDNSSTGIAPTFLQGMHQNNSKTRDERRSVGGVGAHAREVSGGRKARRPHHHCGHSSARAVYDRRVGTRRARSGILSPITFCMFEKDARDDRATAARACVCVRRSHVVFARARACATAGFALRHIILIQ